MKSRSFLAVLVGLFATSTAWADFGCQVEQVLDGGDFENVNDFAFKDYPHIVYKSAGPEGQTLSIGALDFSEMDLFQPSEIRVTTNGRQLLLSAEPAESGQKFLVSVELSSSKAGKGLLEMMEDGKKSAVATLFCKPL